MNIALLFILFFLLITFFISFFEKICDYPGTKSFMESHFKNTFLAKKIQLSYNQIPATVVETKATYYFFIYFNKKEYESAGYTSTRCERS